MPIRVITNQRILGYVKMLVLRSVIQQLARSMEVITGPPTWGDSEETGPDSPSSVLEALALHPSCSSKVRRMSKEFDRLRQYKASAGDPPRGTKSQGDPGTPLAIDDEACSVGSDQTGTFVWQCFENGDKACSPWKSAAHESLAR